MHCTVNACNMFNNKNNNVERSSSVVLVECRTRNQVSPGSNPPLLPFRRLGILFSSLSSLRCINEYLATDSGGNVSDLQARSKQCLIGPAITKLSAGDLGAG